MFFCWDVVVPFLVEVWGAVWFVAFPPGFCLVPGEILGRFVEGYFSVFPHEPWPIVAGWVWCYFVVWADFRVGAFSGG